ncbi:hypothetical protein [Leptospira yasudae]|nr:hypothetical protein [Leptospira yasudae]
MAARSSSIDIPSPNLSKTNSTVMRVPLITGLPSITLGSELNRFLYSMY